MTLKEKTLNVAIKQAIEYVKKDYDINLFKLINWGKKMVKDDLYLKILNKLDERLSDPTNVADPLIEPLCAEPSIVRGTL